MTCSLKTENSCQKVRGLKPLPPYAYNTSWDILECLPLMRQRAEHPFFNQKVKGHNFFAWGPWILPFVDQATVVTVSVVLVQ